MKKKALCILGAALTLSVGLRADWQYDLFGQKYYVQGPVSDEAYDELIGWTGFPYEQVCSYDYSGVTSWADPSASNGSIGCSCDGSCHYPPVFNDPNYEYVDSSFYQWWTCSTAWVEGIGWSSVNSFTDPQYHNDQPYPYGVQSGAKAIVHRNSGLVEPQFRSLDEKNCDGSVNYLGPYAYDC